MRFGLEDDIVKNLITAISKSEAVKKTVVFGSRARGDYKYNSDIDIALYIDGELYPGLFTNIDEAAGIYKINTIIMNKLSNEKLRRNIERDGVEIYNKDKERN